MIDKAVKTMRIVAGLIILSVMVFGLEGCEQKVKVLRRGEAYIDKTYKFKVSPPGKNWSIVVMPRQGNKAQYVSIRNNADPFLSINISAKESNFSSDLSGYVDSIKRQINSFNPDSLNEKRVYLKDIEAHNITSTFKSSCNIGCYFLNAGSQYSIVFSGPNSEVEKYRKEFDEILNNFEFIK